jgi:CubicO group peptidase (beta-lactamase class C family)
MSSRSGRRVLPLSIVVTLVASGCFNMVNVPAGQSAEETARAAFEPFIEAGELQSVSVAIIRDSQIEYVGLGQLAPDDDRAPAPDTLYEIGSVTKPIMGVALASLVVDGQLSLADAASTRLGGTLLPSRDGVDITLGHLVSHHSGLPRDPADRSRYMNDASHEPYTTADLLAAAPDTELLATPGSEQLYSNMGAALAGEIAVNADASDLAGVLSSRVTDPLDMPDTVFEPTQAQRERLAPPFFAGGREAIERPLEELPQPGGLRSTARDLATLVAAYMDADHPYADVLTETRTRVTTRNDKDDRFWGYFWNINGEGEFSESLWHAGTSPGYRASVWFETDGDVGMVSLTNTAHFRFESIGDAVYKALRGQDQSIGGPRAEAELSGDVLDAYVGEYDAPDGSARVSRHDGRLLLEADGQPTLLLFAESDTRFFARRFPVEVAFDSVGGDATVTVAGEEHRVTRAD